MSAATTIRDWSRAMPTLLRVGAAEALAYRAEFIIWMLTSTLPLVMLGLWTSVAAEAPFASWQSRDFVAYYLATVVVRNFTGNWVFWQINEDVRQGTLSMRLLRPIHPFVTYAATHLASVPLRGLVGLPFAAILLASAGREVLTTDAATWLIMAPAMLGAWALSFFLLSMIGSMAFFIDKSMAVFDVYMGVFAVLSGYLLPLSLLPEWAAGVAEHAPFRFMLSYPVELVLGRHDIGGALWLLAEQWAYVIGSAAVTLLIWQRGVRRYEAFGA